MTMTREFAPGGYRFIPGPFQYSGGVAALHGYQIQRMRFRRPVLLERGFEVAAEIIQSAGRPLTAFCACELRSPAPFTEQGFRTFNEVYVGTLSNWGIFDGTINPVARSNVCPAINPPAEPSLLCLLVHDRPMLMHRNRLWLLAAVKPPRGKAATGSAVFGVAIPARRACVRRHASSLAKWRGASAHLRQAGVTPRLPRSTRCTTCIHFSPTRLCGAEPLMPV